MTTHSKLITFLIFQHAVFKENQNCQEMEFLLPPANLSQNAPLMVIISLSNVMAQLVSAGALNNRQGEN